MQWRLQSQIAVRGIALLLIVEGATILAPPQTVTRAIQVRQTEMVASWPGKQKRWALVIGVDRYADTQITTLGGSSNDAKAIADALVRYAGFPQDQVMLLATDQPAERQPTRGNILRRLSNFASVVPADGLLFLSFAGHGMERSNQAFLLPSDAQVSNDVDLLEQTAINVAQIKDRIRKTGVKQVVLVLDACRNDPVGRANADNPLTAAYVRGFNFDVHNREVTAFATLYATAVGERAYEYTEKRQGYFTWEFIEGLKGAAANDKGEITLAALLKYVQDRVPKRVLADLGTGKEQRPFADIGGYQADQLVIAVTSRSPAPPTQFGSKGPLSVDAAAFELIYWDTIKNSDDPKDFASYLQKYPDGQFTDLALRRSQGGKPSYPPRVESAINFAQVSSAAASSKEHLADTLVAQAERAGKAGDVDAALQLLDQARSVRPDHPRLARLQRDLEARKVKASRREQANRADADAHLAKARIYLDRALSLRNVAEANNHYDKAVSLASAAPDLTLIRQRILDGYVNVAQAELTANQPARALKALNYARKRNMSSPPLEQLSGVTQQPRR